MHVTHSKGHLSRSHLNEFKETLQFSLTMTILIFSALKEELQFLVIEAPDHNVLVHIYILDVEMRLKMGKLAGECDIKYQRDRKQFARICVFSHTGVNESTRL